MHFYKCNLCNEVLILPSLNEGLTCCNKEMVELLPNTVEASSEKHIPVFIRNNDELEVSVGSVIHPMEENHYINWILLEDENGYQIVYLNPMVEPKVTFKGVKNPIAIYALCNLHGIWKKEI